MSTAWDTVKSWIEGMQPELVPVEVAAAKDAVIAVEHVLDPEVAKVPVLGPELVTMLNDALNAEEAKISAELEADRQAAVDKANAAMAALAGKRQQVSAVAGG